MPRATARRTTNVILPEPLLAEARAIGIDLSQACEQGLSAAVAAERARRWKEENGAAIEEWNAWVEEHGIPLAKYRQF